MADDDLIAAHLALLRLRGRSPSTLAARERTLARLAAWLACYGVASYGEAGSGSAGSSPVRVPGTSTAQAGQAGLPASVGGHARRAPGLLTATAADLAAWRASLAPLADASVCAYVSHAREYFRWLQDEGHRPDNPATRLPVPRKHRGLPRPVGEDDLARALRLAPPRVRPWLVLAGWCGLRAREIAWLRRDAVLDRAVPPVIVVRDGAKGGRHRVVDMPAFVIAELRPLLPASGYVFRRLDGQPGPNAPWLVSQLSAQAIRASGTDATLHQLRHRYATKLLEASGWNLRLVQEALGHADPATTAVYTAFDRARAAEAAARLPVPGRRLQVVS